MSGESKGEPELTRGEQYVFADLSDLCSAPGYIHAIAYLCFRDCSIRYADEVRPDDMRHLFSRDRLLRTELSTVIGLVAKRQIDFTLPPADTLELYIERTDSLLLELHEVLARGFRLPKAEGVVCRETIPSDALREAIFYGGESAYSYQYRDFAVAKYAQDREWIAATKGFSIEAAVEVLRAVTRLQEERTISVLQSFSETPPHQWTLLPAFEFSAEEIGNRSGIEPKIVNSVLRAFTVPEGETNDGFKSLNDFNVANALPLLQHGDRFVMFQVYSFAEALYDSPFYWMARDDTYRPTAMRHRGQFVEKFAVDALSRVFGHDHVFGGVNILGDKGQKRGEIDVLVLFGDRAIILEAKSKRLTL
jgi:hypothetical protein